MRYGSGELVELGDVVRFDIGPGRFVSGFVMMLGEDYSHLELESHFLEWVTGGRVLKEGDVVVELLSDDGESSPDRYMFTSLCCVELLGKNRQ